MSTTPSVVVVVVMGVSASGKTTVGRLLAERLGWEFVDGDDLHPAGNLAQMRSGRALTDADREPWLLAIRERIADHVRRGAPLVLACSALRRSFRRRMRPPEVAAERVAFVLLDVPQAELERRLAAREGHFFPAHLLDSQLAAFEPADATEHAHVLAVDGTEPPSSIATHVASRLLARPAR